MIYVSFNEGMIMNDEYTVKGVEERIHGLFYNAIAPFSWKD
jgi:hypothetical protein